MAKKRIPKTTSISLKESEVKVLRHMIDGLEGGATPSVRETCEHFGWSSPNAAHRHMRSLASKGLIELRGRGVAARIMPLALRLYGRKQTA